MTNNGKKRVGGRADYLHFEIFKESIEHCEKHPKVGGLKGGGGEVIIKETKEGQRHPNPEPLGRLRESGKGGKLS